MKSSSAARGTLDLLFSGNDLIRPSFIRVSFIIAFDWGGGGIAEVVETYDLY